MTPLEAFAALIAHTPPWGRPLIAALVFVLCVALFAAGPLVTPSRHTRHRHPRPSWAHGRVRARLHVRRLTRSPRS